MVKEFITYAVHWIHALPPVGIYFVFFLVAYLENIIPPIPGDVIVAFGGYMAAESIISPGLILALTTIASVVGFMNVYALGRRWGEQIEQQQSDFWIVRFISLEYIEKVQQWMRRWGQKVVVANRFLAGTRSVISLSAGISRTKISSTVISAALSSLLWNTILLGFGWIVHSNWRQIGYYLSLYGNFILIVIALGIATRLVIRHWHKKAAV